MLDEYCHCFSLACMSAQLLALSVWYYVSITAKVNILKQAITTADISVTLLTTHRVVTNA
jgi:hypothetical protein